MQLIIDDQPQTFIPLQTFCKTWGLPAEFQVDYFEPKNWEGLGSMKGAGEALTTMREAVRTAVPETVTPLNILSVVDILTKPFRYQMEKANKQMGLRYHDVGFAVAGFQDVMQGVVYNLLHLKMTYQGDLAQVREHFNFSSVYQNWLDASARLSATVHTYQHGDNQFEVRIVNHIYGRVGLVVNIADETHYVLDKALACPGEGFMWELCQELAQTLCERFSE